MIADRHADPNHALRPRPSSDGLVAGAEHCCFARNGAAVAIEPIRGAPAEAFRDRGTPRRVMLWRTA